jgi:hypothetical protein
MSVIKAIPGTQKDFELRSGNSWIYTWQVLNFDATPMDLTQALSHTVTVWEKNGDPALPLIEFLLDNGLSIGGAGSSFYTIQKPMPAIKRNYLYRARTDFGNNLLIDSIYGAHIYQDKKD